MNRRSGFARIAMTAAGALLVTFAMQSMALPGTAEARCRGHNNPINSTLVVNGTTYVTEDPAAGTCNSNGHYTARFRSHFDGWFASVHFRQTPTSDSTTHVFRGQPGTSWHEYEFHEDDRYNLMTLCLSSGSPDGPTAGRITYCGWGSDYRVSTGQYINPYYYGANSGF